MAFSVCSSSENASSDSRLCFVIRQPDDVSRGAGRGLQCSILKVPCPLLQGPSRCRTKEITLYIMVRPMGEAIGAKTLLGSQISFQKTFVVLLCLKACARWYGRTDGMRLPLSSRNLLGQRRQRCRELNASLVQSCVTLRCTEINMSIHIKISFSVLVLLMFEAAELHFQGLSCACWMFSSVSGLYH